jgi:hydrogenase maturation protease
MIVVIGCGNATRCDDGVGPEIVRRLRARAADGRDCHLNSADLRLIDAGTDGMAAMFAARGCRSLIIVDACRSGAPPGAVFELPGTEVEQGYTPTFNLHDFRWDHALYAGRQIFREAFPSDVVVLLIEAESIAFGTDLSAPVAKAATLVVDRITELVRERGELLPSEGHTDRPLPPASSLKGKASVLPMHSRKDGR